MSQTVDVDGMTLTMPADWWVWKYDDSAFHRHQFQSFAEGFKAAGTLNHRRCPWTTAPTQKASTP